MDEVSKSLSIISLGRSVLNSTLPSHPSRPLAVVIEEFQENMKCFDIFKFIFRHTKTLVQKEKYTHKVIKVA